MVGCFAVVGACVCVRVEGKGEGGGKGEDGGWTGVEG